MIDVKKILVWSVCLLVALASVSAEVILYDGDESKEVLGETRLFEASDIDLALFQDFIDSVEESVRLNDASISGGKLRSIRESNPDLFAYMKENLPSAVRAFEGDDAEFAGFSARFREGKAKYESEIATAKVLGGQAETAAAALAATRLISIEGDKSWKVERQPSQQEKIALLELENLELKAEVSALQAEMHSRNAWGIPDLSDLEAALANAHYSINNNGIRIEFLRASEYLDFSKGDVTSNTILYSALRNANVVFEEKSARLVPKTWAAGSESADYLKKMGLPEQFFTAVKYSIDSFNPFYLVGDVSKTEESWNYFYYRWALFSVSRAKSAIDSGKAATVQDALAFLKQESARKRAARLDEIKQALDSKSDLELYLNEEAVLPGDYNGKLTLNGGKLDVSGQKPGGDFLIVGVGPLGGRLIERGITESPDDRRTRVVYGSLYGNDISRLLVLDGRVVEEKQLDLKTRPQLEYNRDFIDNYFFNDKNSLADDWGVYFLENDLFVRAGVKLADASISEEEKDKIRLEQAVLLREAGSSNVAAAIASSLPPSTKVTYKGSQVSAQGLYDDINGRVNLLVFRPDSDEFLGQAAPDVVVSLVNPASWLAYGLIAKGGAAVIGRFSVGRTYFAYVDHVNARVAGYLGEGSVKHAAYNIVSSVGQGFIAGAAGSVWPPLEFVAVALGGGYGHLKLKHDFGSALLDADGNLIGVVRYVGRLEKGALGSGFRDLGNGAYLYNSGSRSFVLAPQGGNIAAPAGTRLLRGKDLSAHLAEAKPRGGVPPLGSRPLELTDVRLREMGFAEVQLEDGDVFVALPLSREAAERAPAELGCLLQVAAEITGNAAGRGCRFHFSQGDKVYLPGFRLRRFGVISGINYEPQVKIYYGGNNWFVHYSRQDALFYTQGYGWIPLKDMDPEFVRVGDYVSVNGVTGTVQNNYRYGIADVRIGNEYKPFGLEELYPANVDRNLNIRRQRYRPYPQPFPGQVTDWHYDSKTVARIAGKVRSRYGSGNIVDVMNGVAREVKAELPYDMSRQWAADRAGSLTGIISCGGGVCRHNAPITTGVATRLGLSARELVFNNPPHTVTVVDVSGGNFKLKGGDYWIIDGSLGTATHANSYFRRGGGGFTDMHYWSESQNSWVRWNPFG
ncbi:MAG: hypothetical protein HY544_00780 [Candidatus Diapherotrites archaeon]|uniref:Uncharacterized protein n=1 Tax=Candidatus Iainarchaeum sp. TaxID=3101447 RepID=A0A8T3YKA6_9ARCH|nr:hypothetical protein [Candidatus Diapherotrites archaeon]